MKRREFLKTMTAGAAAMTLPGCARGIEKEGTLTKEQVNSPAMQGSWSLIVLPDQQLQTRIYPGLTTCRLYGFLRIKLTITSNML